MIKEKYALIFNGSLCNSISLLDLKTHAKTNISFNQNDLVQHCVCTRIDNDKFFLCGGFSGQAQNTVRIVDIKNKQIENLTPTTPLLLSSSCYYKGDVFIFGGTPNNSTPLSTCKKYNIINKFWLDIQSLPEPNFNTTAYLINSKVLISGYQSPTIFEYLPQENIFSKTNYVLTSSSHKYVFKNWIVCFGSSLYEIDENGKMVERQKITETFSALNSSCSFIRKNYIYFILAGPRIYRININTKSLESIKVN